MRGRSRPRMSRTASVALLLVMIGATACSDAPEQAPEGTVAMPKVAFAFPNEAYDPVRAQLAVMLQAEWKKLGIEVDAKPSDFDTLLETIQSNPDAFNAVISGYPGNAERYDPDPLLRRPFSCASIESGQNFSGYCNKEYDDVVNQQAAISDPEERKKLVYQAQDILARDIPSLALYHLQILSAWNSRRFSAPRPYQAETLWWEWASEAKPLTGDRRLKVGQTFDIESANPLVPTGGGNEEYFTLLYDTLSRVTATGETIPWAATGWNLENPTTLKVTLRDGMTFHDGRPVTSKDVVFSADLLRKSPLWQDYLTPIKSVQAQGDKQVVINLTAPFAPFATTVLSKIIILPEHVWSKHAANPNDFENIPAIGSGQFKWGYWKKDQEVELEANKRHWAPPQVDSLLGVTYANLDGVFRGLANQDIDIHQASLLVNQYNELGKQGHIQRSALPDVGVYYLGFNLRKPPFNDPAFRQAIAYTIPYDRFIDALFDGLATPGQGFVAPANKVYHNPDVKLYPYDPAKARETLEQAGYKWSKDGKLFMPSKG
jgi:peptide/nickel transport system substrate-binding protein